MTIFNEILYWINTVLLAFVSVAFGIQIIYVLLFFLPKKKYPDAKNKHKFGIIIPARNEESVIGDTIKSILNQNYDISLMTIFVIAHNCTDNTAEVAKKYGATVIECIDENPSHKRKSCALKKCFETIFNNHEFDDIESFLIFDADTLVHPDYIKYMNDAYDSGVKLARGYQNAKNLCQNIISGVSGLWYIRDCRFSCHSRSALHVGQMLVGSGMMVASSILREDGGWTAMGTSEDAEFTINQLFKGHKAQYVPDAVIYEDQPSSIKDIFNRNVRMGHGLNKLFFTHGIKCLGKFFISFKYTFLDMFLTLLFIPIATICCLWMPLYYGYDIIFNAVIGNVIYVENMLRFIGIILLCAFVIPFILQAFLVVALDRKRMEEKKFSKIVPAILSFPLFMILYAIGITVGAFSRPKWKAVKRSKIAFDQMSFAPNRSIAAEDFVLGDDPLLKAQDAISTEEIAIEEISFSAEENKPKVNAEANQEDEIILKVAEG